MNVKTTVFILSLVLSGALCGQEAPEEARIEMTAKLIEIPGKFPPNDLYDYVYVMKYEVIKVHKGEYKEKTVLVGHYNPRIPRNKIKDKMKTSVRGSLKRFEPGDVHRLVIASPMETYWDDAVVDEYFESDERVRYFALKADPGGK